jgi:hypothetical protein
MDKVGNQDILKRSRIHPFTVLIAWNQYKVGHGDKGKLTWTVNENIVKVLEKAFYIAADASRATMLDAPITGCLIEPLTSTAKQNFLPVGATKLKAA